MKSSTTRRAGRWGIAAALVAIAAAGEASAEQGPPPAASPAPAPVFLPAAEPVASTSTIETERTTEPRDRRPDRAPAPPDEEREEPIDAADTRHAPPPDQASGVARRPGESTGNRLRVIPRALLFVPRLALEVVNAPVRGAFWVYDRYELNARARDIFFNDAGTVGLYPVADVTSGFGFTGGARFIHRDLFGEGERLSMRASFGGLYQQQYIASVHTGDRLGSRLRLEAEGEYEIDPRERFFGIGNGDETEIAAPVDPYEAELAADTRFRQNVGRVFGRAHVLLFGPVSTRLTSGFLWKRFARSSPGDISEGTDIAEHFMTSELPGWDQGASYGYHELELRYDSRRPHDPFESSSLPSTGWLLAGYGGIARGFDRAPVDYVRYGGDVQRYVRLGESPRVLVLRALAEQVSGDMEHIPFSDLPRLGGPILLRGYERDRFRDRAMALTSAEYQFDVLANLAGYVFVDAGRVYPSLADVSVEGVRVGYGGGVQFHTQRSFVARANVASSVDGGIFFNLTFDPVHEPRSRVERD